MPPTAIFIDEWPFLSIEIRIFEDVFETKLYSEQYSILCLYYTTFWALSFWFYVILHKNAVLWLKFSKKVGRWIECSIKFESMDGIHRPKWQIDRLNRRKLTYVDDWDTGVHLLGKRPNLMVQPFFENVLFVIPCWVWGKWIFSEKKQVIMPSTTTFNNT